MNFIDLSGKIFFRLAVISRADNKGKHTMWNCVCLCGREKVVSSDDLKYGHTKSCGCYHIESATKQMTKHGMYGIPEYRAWRSILDRCYRVKNKRYKDYGGRGIIMCDRWVNGFENFFFDMGKKPHSKYTIERMDNDGNYEPSNCRWASRLDQASNTRRNKFLEIDGVRLTYSQWERALSLRTGCIHEYIKRGKDVVNILKQKPSYEQFTISARL